MNYKYKKDINENIFRGYDIRGIVPTEIDEDSAYTIGLGFGTHIKKMGNTTCIVGHDNRLSSENLNKALKEGVKQTGINIIDIGLVTTPMYYYACIKLKVYSGVMVTASHNPKDDNGFKFAFDEAGNCKGQEIQDFLAEIQEGNFETGQGSETTYDIKYDYLKLYRTNLNFGDRKVKVVIDPGNGTTSIIAEELYKMFPIDVITINGESDGHFPNHHPDPCIEANLEQLKAKVLETGADVGLGFDGDGDRLGVVSNTAKFIPTDKYMIMIIRDIINKVEKKEFLYDVKCSKSLSDEIEKLGGKGLCYRTGNSYTKAKVRDDDLPFGGELSGHVYFRDHEYYSTEELKFKASDDTKFDVVDKVLEYAKSKGYKYIDIDGVRVEFNDGWALVRASNTGPNITARFEATTKERLQELQDEFIGVVNENIA